MQPEMGTERIRAPAASDATNSPGTSTRLAVIIMLALASVGGGCASTGGRSHSANGVMSGASGAHDALPFPGFRSPPLASTNTRPHVVSYPVYRDPLIGFNRAIFAFNDIAYRYVLIPVANGYTWIMPDAVERSVDNVFYNIKTPIYAVNHLLQWKPGAMGRNLLRFGMNTTIGILGIYDPAHAWFGMEREATHLEDTLAGYGMGYGIYIVLPLFGPSDLRNGLSTIGDHFLNPIPYVTEFPLSTGIQSFDYLQDFAPGADRYRVLRRRSDDPYIFFRNLYLQKVQRDADYR